MNIYLFIFYLFIYYFLVKKLKKKKKKMNFEEGELSCSILWFQLTHHWMKWYDN